MFGLGPLELCLIGAIAVMLYGKRLPEVGRSVGGTLAEFKKQKCPSKKNSEENGTSGEEKLGEISGDADVQIATGNTLWQILRCEEDPDVRCDQSKRLYSNDDNERNQLRDGGSAPPRGLRLERERAVGGEWPDGRHQQPHSGGAD